MAKERSDEEIALTYFEHSLLTDVALLEFCTGPDGFENEQQARRFAVFTIAMLGPAAQEYNTVVVRSSTGVWMFPLRQLLRSIPGLLRLE